MCTKPTPPDDAYNPDADRAGPDASRPAPEWLVRLISVLILFLLQHVAARRRGRCVRLPAWWRDDRPDLPPGSAQAFSASSRGQFGCSIARMCRRHGIGPGHADWPELSRAILAFGGSLQGFRAGAPAFGSDWWENPKIVPGMVGRAVAAPAAAAIASLLARQAATAFPSPPPPHTIAAQPTRRAASWRSWWLSAPWPLLPARAGTGPPTGPPLPTRLPILSV